MGQLLLELLAGLVIGYLFASFPVGYFVGRAYGVDIRQHGSGRTGGSNVLRTLGWVPFLLTITGDGLKGAIPVLLVNHVLFPSSPTAAAATVVGVVLGCNWSIIIALMAGSAPVGSTSAGFLEPLKRLFAHAKGGVGVIATACAALTLFWPPVLILAIIGVAALVITRYASLSSVLVAALYPVLMAYFVVTGSAPAVYLLMSSIAAAIVIYVLIPNLKRLRAGTEKKFGERLAEKR